MSNAKIFAATSDTAESYTIGPAENFREAIIQAALEMLEENTPTFNKQDGDGKPEEDAAISAGRCFTFVPHVRITADQIIENLINEACEECGEAADSWLVGIGRETMKALDEKLKLAVEQIQATFEEFLKEQGEVPGFGSIPKPVTWYWNQANCSWVVAAQIVPVDEHVPTEVKCCAHGIPNPTPSETHTCRHCNGPQE